MSNTKKGNLPPEPERVANPMERFQGWLDAEIRAAYADRIFLPPRVFADRILEGLTDTVTRVLERNAGKTRFEHREPLPEVTVADLVGALTEEVAREAAHQKDPRTWDAGDNRAVEAAVKHETRVLEEELLRWCRRVQDDPECRPLAERLITEIAERRPDLIHPATPPENKQKLAELTEQVERALGEADTIMEALFAVLERVQEAARAEAELLRGFADSPSWGDLPQQLAVAAAAKLESWPQHGRGSLAERVTWRRWKAPA